MHHDRRPAALILLGVTETDALHLPVLVTNLKCALECSWQDPHFEISRLGGGTSLGLTPSGLPVFLPRASRLVSRIGRHLSRLVRRGDDRDTRRPSSQCLGQELEHVGEVVYCRKLCFSTTVLMNLR